MRRIMAGLAQLGSALLGIKVAGSALVLQVFSSDERAMAAAVAAR
jgi:hypothetical protein